MCSRAPRKTRLLESIFILTNQIRRCKGLDKNTQILRLDHNTRQYFPYFEYTNSSAECNVRGLRVAIFQIINLVTANRGLREGDVRHLGEWWSSEDSYAIALTLYYWQGRYMLTNWKNTPEKHVLGDTKARVLGDTKARVYLSFLYSAGNPSGHQMHRYPTSLRLS